jgi:hypothetical protein
MLVFFGFVFFVVGRGMVPKVMATVEARDSRSRTILPPPMQGAQGRPTPRRKPGGSRPTASAPRHRRLIASGQG